MTSCAWCKTLRSYSHGCADPLACSPITTPSVEYRRSWGEKRKQVTRKGTALCPETQVGSSPHTTSVCVRLREGQGRFSACENSMCDSKGDPSLDGTGVQAGLLFSPHVPFFLHPCHRCSHSDTVILQQPGDAFGFVFLRECRTGCKDNHHVCRSKPVGYQQCHEVQPQIILELKKKNSNSEDFDTD